MSRDKDIYMESLDEDEVIPVYFDKCFKLIFGDSNHLERLNSFLSVILKKDVKVVSLLNPELIGDNRENKKNTVDLVCKLNHEYVSVEVNTSFGQKVINRNLSFIFRMIGKELKPGEDYTEISNYYQINLNTVDYKKEHYDVVYLTSVNTGSIYSKSIEIININILYYAKLCYNITNKDELSETDIWLGIIGTNSKSVIDKITKDNTVLKEIGDIVKKFSEDDDLVFEYNREKLMMDDMKEVLTKEVTKKVTEKNTLDMARKMKMENVSKEIISKVTGLSIEEIKEL